MVFNFFKIDKHRAQKRLILCCLIKILSIMKKSVRLFMK